MNSKNTPYPSYLKENMPMICPNSWVADQVIEKYGASGHYQHAEEDALNIGIGCRKSVYIISFYTYLTS